jgi:uncharacterized membrane protein YphA (DoxX/SURF4 family)
MSDVIISKTRHSEASGQGGEQQQIHNPGHAWSPINRLLFRFSFLYLVFSGSYWIFAIADKSTSFLGKPYNALWRPCALWVAGKLFHPAATVEPTFVRDTRYLYALLLCFLVFAFVSAMVWSSLDRRRTQYVELNDWLRTFLRYVLAYLMLHYGLDKIFLIQFPAPSVARLTERFGDFSPSSLMWAFIGSSPLYTVFGGLAEVLGALLLLFRRTITLGSLITFAVMFNVTVMDFSYDVGVKLFCVHILLMAMYLVLPDGGRLVDFFFLNHTTVPAQLNPAVHQRPARKILLLMKVCVVFALIVPLTFREWKSYRQTGMGAPLPPLYGLYEVEVFSLNGVEHPPLLTDTTRWRYVILETPNIISVRHMDESLSQYRMRYDAPRHRIDLDAAGDAADKSTLNISQPTADSMTLEGTFAGSALSAKLRRIDRSSFTLINRGFHWISESSFIR